MSTPKSAFKLIEAEAGLTVFLGVGPMPRVGDFAGTSREAEEALNVDATGSTCHRSFLTDSSFLHLMGRQITGSSKVS